MNKILPIKKNIICTHELTDSELMSILYLAQQMKRDRFAKKWISLLQSKTFLMFFHNPSVRTRLSFETAMTELGGHAIYLTPEMGRFKSRTHSGESIEDAVNVMSRFASGIGLRIEDSGSYYGASHQYLQEFAKWAKVPVINMADDKYHPCQALADIMGLLEAYQLDATQKPAPLKNKTLLITWAKGRLHRSKTSPQDTASLGSRLGMNIKIARPDGFDLDSDVYDRVKYNCQQHGSSFEILNDPESGYESADVVYSRNWISETAYGEQGLNKEAEIEKSLKLDNWQLTQEKMSRGNNPFFIHPMPVDRNYEVTDEVASGKRSLIYDIAENRLHVQKAILALTMSSLGEEILC